MTIALDVQLSSWPGPHTEIQGAYPYGPAGWVAVRAAHNNALEAHELDAHGRHVRRTILHGGGHGSTVGIAPGNRLVVGAGTHLASVPLDGHEHTLAGAHPGVTLFPSWCSGHVDVAIYGTLVATRQVHHDHSDTYTIRRWSEVTARHDHRLTPPIQVAPHPGRRFQGFAFAGGRLYRLYDRGTNTDAYVESTDYHGRRKRVLQLDLRRIAGKPGEHWTSREGEGLTWRHGRLHVGVRLSTGDRRVWRSVAL